MYLKFICYYFFWFTDPLQIFKNSFNLVKTIDIHLWPLFIVGNINKWLNYSLYASKRSKWNFVMNYPSHSLDGISHSLTHSLRMFICSFIYYNGRMFTRHLFIIFIYLFIHFCLFIIIYNFPPLSINVIWLIWPRRDNRQ